jgi:hypothetical protein
MFHPTSGGPQVEEAAAVLHQTAAADIVEARLDIEAGSPFSA